MSFTSSIRIPAPAPAPAPVPQPHEIQINSRSIKINQSTITDTSIPTPPPHISLLQNQKTQQRHCSVQRQRAILFTAAEKDKEISRTWHNSSSPFTTQILSPPVTRKAPPSAVDTTSKAQTDRGFFNVVEVSKNALQFVFGGVSLVSAFISSFLTFVLFHLPFFLSLSFTLSFILSFFL